MPRVKLELESLSDCAYDLRYYVKLQGFVYSLLKGTTYDGVHEKPGYKNFCFSNIYPVNAKNGSPPSIKKGETKNLLISSPDAGMVSAFASSLAEVECFNVGDMRFALRRVEIMEPRIGKKAALVARTPVIIRIPKWNYGRYGIASEHPYVYWRPRIDFSAFLRQLEENLLKKYQDYLGVKLNESAYLPLFQQFLFRKPVCNHLILNGREFRVFGSIWEFYFDYLTREQRRLLQFGLDAGFGERNSLGFGFVDVRKHFSGAREKEMNSAP